MSGVEFESLRAYVRTALELQGHEFSEATVAEITRQFARIESIARTLQSRGPDADTELHPASLAGPAPVFHP